MVSFGAAADCSYIDDGLVIRENCPLKSMSQLSKLRLPVPISEFMTWWRVCPESYDFNFILHAQPYHVDCCVAKIRVCRSILSWFAFIAAHANDCSN